MTDPAQQLSDLTTQVAIIGGGIAGLWTACRLSKLGYQTLLIEQHALGSEQTLASQGILHGGIKYAVSPSASSAAAAIAGMPAIWKACLQGQGELDLTAAKITSNAQWMWTAGSTLAGLTALVASKVIRTSVQSVPAREACPGLHHAPASRSIYRVEEPILDIESVITALRDQFLATGGKLLRARASRDAQGHCTLHLADGSICKLHASALILTAGLGNQSLSPSSKAQQRPLQMVMLRKPSLPPLFGHCIAPLSDKPRLTITTHTHTSGDTIWYIGGQLAEHGVTQSPQELVTTAKRELAECLPWINLDGARFATCRWIRAEGLTPEGKRPDEPIVHVQRAPGNSTPQLTLTAWPTKLVFAPLIAQKLIDQLQLAHITPAPSPTSNLAIWPSDHLAICSLPWNLPEVTWS
jgi:glycerol-3-phosphate dehydrogenase